MEEETIFALGSGSGVAGIAVIRVSGRRVSGVLSALCDGVPRARQAVLRQIRDPVTGHQIDSGVILFFPGPKSFTGEDIAEFQVHGSRAVVRELLRCLGNMDGLRPAQPGEFTLRAFRNGRMDLLEVEALGDLLAAESVMQARFAVEAQQRLRLAAETWRVELIGLRVLTEACIDFSDEDDVVLQGDLETAEPTDRLIASLSRAIDSFDRGERLRTGFRVAILGAPNAGKSSLLNALARRDVAIVSEEAGTTRDVIEVHLELDGCPVILFDTAGIRATDSAVEQEGIRRARARAEHSDLRLWLSAADNPTEPELAHCIILQTKADLFDSAMAQSGDNLKISTQSGLGMDHLVALLGERARSALDYGQDVIVGHERQRSALKTARDALQRLREIPSSRLELRSEELRGAENALEALVGRLGYEDMLGEIFSRFCIGK